MILNNKWVPEVPRPELTDEAFEKFIKVWIEKEYPDDCEGIPAEETGLYEALLSDWKGSDELMAEDLIKCYGWSYAEAKEFEEKSLSFAINKKEREMFQQWVAENGYTLPFPTGSRVKIDTWRGAVYGVIAQNQGEYFSTKGQAVVNLDIENAIVTYSGTVLDQRAFPWEMLELVEEQNETL
ncbi:hypothetical protein B0186_03970 [Canicola haemoglobinophilus]|uniref:Uncharacterized protein n=1 Tax=Canicola haemoglobinophilus TaxID=733 RepID=A0A1V4B213_9PAST|nr:hypothetical protein [Canicola haemoglobinophilus]OOS01243.1 hypothetical protein B0186_03970 [Canicola haemoglobinophilus]STO54450.1 Uncharacterised protein [Canicola haemoglobinophilus]STO60083.1 Uncharacterised protein [Canicola haemoglobinophilus]STO68984.1 Uncharacterised protein [Canicola haemoglobinophilus]